MDEKFLRAIEEITAEIERISMEKGAVTVAVDGNSGAGKTLLANELYKRVYCNTYSIDDFFLPLKERTAEVFSQLGGNIDRKRFKEQVLEPVKNGEHVLYRVFSCKEQEIVMSVPFTRRKISIIEGTYSCHPDFYDYYDLHIFLAVSPEVQKERIMRRGGKKEYDVFSRIWIPREEEYFEKTGIKEKCEMVFEF